MKSNFVFLFACILLLLQSCQNTQMLPLEDKTSLIRSLTIEHIEKIKVSQMPEFIDPVEITNAGEIESVMQYINRLHPGMEIINTNVCGAAYHIEIFYDDGLTSNISLVGNSFIIVDDNPAYSLSYDEAAAFDTVIGNILLNKYRSENSKEMICGEVLFVSSEESGRNTACEVKTDDGTIISVNLNTVKHIISITGAGWLILHVGDIVEIGMDDGFIADMVFITKSAML